jgi:hypothetical protein
MKTALAMSLFLAGCNMSGTAMPNNAGGTPGAVTEIPVKNAALEPIAGVASKSWAQTFGANPPTVLRAFVNDPDWTVEMNPNGTPKYRHIRVVLDYKGGQTGQCHRWNCAMNSDAQGGGQWGAASIMCQPGMMANATCESIAAERGSPP